MTPFCEQDIKSDEGCRLTAYEDTLGFSTIGYGHCGVRAGTVWTQHQADLQFGADVTNAEQDLTEFLPWWKTLDDARQDVLVNMAFQLGIKGLLAFRNTLAFARAGKWADAAAGMLASAWASETPNRAKRLARQMLTGVRVAP